MFFRIFYLSITESHTFKWFPIVEIWQLLFVIMSHFLLWYWSYVIRYVKIESFYPPSELRLVSLLKDLLFYQVFCPKIYFIWYMYSNSFFNICLKYLFLSFYFQLFFIYILGMSLVTSTDIDFDFLIQSHNQREV